MEPTTTHDPTEPSQAPPGRFSLGKLCLGLTAGPVVGIVWAWMAQETQAYAALVLLFPILVGILAGITIVGIARFARMGHRPTILLSVVLAAATAALGQHYFSYIVFVSHYSTAKGDKTAENENNARFADAQTAAGGGGAPPQDLAALAHKLAPSFGDYLRGRAQHGRPLVGEYVAKGWVAWLSWAVDAILTLAAALAVTIPAFRVPYCNRCRTWYRTVRNGKIDVPTARRLAETCGVEEIAGLHSPRYRLSCCHAGCGPTYCELSWEEPNGAIDLVRLWLDAERRKKVTAILDEVAEEDAIDDEG